MKLWHDNELGVRGCKWHRCNKEQGAWFRQSLTWHLVQKVELIGQLDLCSPVSRSEKKNGAMPIFKVLLCMKTSLIGLSKLKVK